MHHAAAVRVIHRNLRWEVSVDGVTRPLLDWLWSRGRAIEHARDRANELGATMIFVDDRAGGSEETIVLQDPVASPRSRLDRPVSGRPT